ncbi:hypothetical protein CBR_g19981 [Chara braunii]|uniref:Alpha 1,4-glycosyltransferase domain-containing protein n=1 Tax=Chara braunii TaxID=69332 RepID=A0A388KZA4_CHABU|nr:hypothetical protein CBR_g19981 [Chara braunii]|eukprot:GBG75348.1 hypothetical protein CBR_g19981 [Chara braunii]
MPKPTLKVAAIRVCPLVAPLTAMVILSLNAVMYLDALAAGRAGGRGEGVIAVLNAPSRSRDMLRERVVVVPNTTHGVGEEHTNAEDVDCAAIDFAGNRILSAEDFGDLASVPSRFIRLRRSDASAGPMSFQESTLSGRRDRRDDDDGGTAYTNATGRDRANKQAQRSRVVVSSGKTKIPDRVFFLNMYQNIRGCAHTQCSIESFLAKNPNYTVYIYSSNLTYFRTKWSERKDPRIVLKTADFADIFSGTPFENWYASGTYRKTRWIPNNLSNAARLALVWKYGGTYLDMDFISLNPMPAGLGSAVAAEDDKSINNAFIRFSAGHQFVREAMKDFVADFSGNLWGHQGPKLLTRVFMRNCLDIDELEEWLVSRKLPRDEAKALIRAQVRDLNATRLSAAYVPPDFCYDLTVMKRESVYPLWCSEAKLLKTPWRQACKLCRELQEKAIMLHYWGHSFPHNDSFSESSIMGKLMTATCPRTFAQCGWGPSG